MALNYFLRDSFILFYNQISEGVKVICRAEYANN